MGDELSSVTVKIVGTYQGFKWGMSIENRESRVQIMCILGIQDTGKFLGQKHGYREILTETGK